MSGKKEQVADMFDNIAGKYDFLNHFLSMGIDKIWRRRAIKLLKSYSPESILDIATGTGDFAIAASKINPKNVTGIDISKEMLKLGIKKIKKKNLSQIIKLYEGDSENINFNDNSFDAAIVAFGVRNFENLSLGIKEIYRVLKPGGAFIVLEFSKPGHFPVKQIYNFYFKNILPYTGRVFSKDKSAYTYLPDSVNAFPDGEDFKTILRNHAFVDVKHYPQTCGIATIYVGEKK